MTDIQDYSYLLPEKSLALEPAVPRDSSKLFIYDTAIDKISFDYFYNLDKYLPKDSFLVMNNTKVLPARVTMKKENGAKIVILFLVNELEVMDDGLLSHLVKVMADRKINIGDLIYFDPKNYLKVIRQNENIFELEFNFSREHLFSLLKKYGVMPIPPYLKKSTLTRDELLERYQTIFARAPSGARLASAAAPTASLHFTEKVFSKLEKKGIEKYFITLHVGMGTFAPITEENMKQKKLHNEYYEVDSQMFQYINILKQKGKKLVAAGTTVVRTLESIAIRINQKTENRSSDKSDCQITDFRHQSSDFRIPFSGLSGPTSLFIFPPYDFKMVDVMITNFHLPKSSLMMLVEAFLQYKKAKRSLVELYNIAIKNNFRFYSFGDVMLIL